MRFFFTLIILASLLLLWLDRQENSLVRQMINRGNDIVHRKLLVLGRRGVFLDSEQRALRLIWRGFGNWRQPGGVALRSLGWSLLFVALFGAGLAAIRATDMPVNAAMPGLFSPASVAEGIVRLDKLANCVKVTQDSGSCGMYSGFPDPKSMLEWILSVNRGSLDPEILTMSSDERTQLDLFFLGMIQEFIRTHHALILRDGDTYTDALISHLEHSSTLLRYHSLMAYATILLPTLFLSACLTSWLVGIGAGHHFNSDIRRGAFVIGSACADLLLSLMLFVVLALSISFLGPFIKYNVEIVLPLKFDVAMVRYLDEDYAPKLFAYFEANAERLPPAVATEVATWIARSDDGGLLSMFPGPAALIHDISAESLDVQTGLSATLTASLDLLTSNIKHLLVGQSLTLGAPAAVRNWSIVFALLPLLVHVVAVLANLLHAGLVLLVLRPLIEVTKIASAEGATRFYGGALGGALTSLLAIWLT